jgi:hypothetical protein
MVQFQKSNFSRELPKTKAELRQILAEAVRNTRPSAGRRPKPAPKAEKKDRGEGGLCRAKGGRGRVIADSFHAWISLVGVTRAFPIGISETPFGAFLTSREV